jgi:hypothetical protein
MKWHGVVMNDNPTVLDAVEVFLKLNGFDGLYNVAGECGCFLDDLEPCGEMCSNCHAGHRVILEDGAEGVGEKKGVE